jgi:hypothetical protein
MTRQNHYKERKKKERREVAGRYAEEPVKWERRVHLWLGRRKLFHILAPELAQDGAKLGRDRFFSVLRERGCRLRDCRLSRRKPQTRGTACPYSAIW